MLLTNTYIFVKEHFKIVSYRENKAIPRSVGSTETVLPRKISCCIRTVGTLVLHANGFICIRIPLSGFPYKAFALLKVIFQQNFGLSKPEN